MRYAAAVVVIGLAALLVFMAQGASGPKSSAAKPSSHPATVATVARPSPVALRGGYGIAPAPSQIHLRLLKGLRSGLLFDVRTGKVLWNDDPTLTVPIASLTKMMTALVVVAHSRPTDRVLITRQAIDFTGSGVGLLPLHKKVSLEALLYGLLLPSGNDAAIALAQHVAGTQPRFISMMNARAQSLGLTCTHFTTVSGIVDQGNHSCAGDLAVLAHAVLTNRELAPIVATSSIILPFPIKGGKLYLYNNNPLLRLGFPGTDGVKTGFTDAAGACLVATVRRGRKWLGVVLLHSDDPPDQAMRLLNAGFATRGA